MRTYSQFLIEFKCYTCKKKIPDYSGSYTAPDGKNRECTKCNYDRVSATKAKEPLNAVQNAAMKQLQAMVKKDGTFPTVQLPKGFSKPVILTGVNVTTLNSLILKKYLDADNVFLGGKCYGLKILRRV